MNGGNAEPEELLSTGDVTFLVMSALLAAILLWALVLVPNQQRDEKLAALTAQSTQIQVNEWHAAGELSCPAAGMYLVDPQPGQFIQKDTVVSIVGRADIPKLNRYVLQYDHKIDGWTTIKSFNGEPQVEPLGNWITSDLNTGLYSIRLAALDAFGNPMPDTACVTSVWIVEPSAN